MITLQSAMKHIEVCFISNQLKQKPAENYIIKIKDKFSHDYWLYVSVPSDSTLDDLDFFLREIWLDCCDHLSAFTINLVEYTSDNVSESGILFGHRQQTMNMPIKKVLTPSLVFTHEYDFGSTTDLQLEVVRKCEMSNMEDEIQLLMRNEMPTFHCDRCPSIAKQICGYCSDYFCKKCATEEHGCDEEFFLAVLNSPRSGVCAYDGA